MTERRIGAVFSDVDGTQIAPGNNGLPSSAVSAAAYELRSNGIPLLEVTGRSHALMRKIVAPLHLRENLCVLDGGATIARATSGEVVWSQWLSGDLTAKTVRAIGGLCTRINFDMESRAKEPPGVLAALEAERLVLADTPSVFAVFDKQHGPEILEGLAPISGTQHTPIMNFDKHTDLRCIQVVSDGVDKKFGVEKLRERAGLNNVPALAIGDNHNDIALFGAMRTEGDLKVAMRNPSTPEELLDLADHVVKSVDDDGFAEAMTRYVL